MVGEDVKTSYKGINSVAYIPLANAIVSIAGSKGSIAQDAPTPTESKELNLSYHSKIALWGDNNLFPYEWEKAIEENDTLRDAIEKEVDRIYAGGIEVGYEDYQDGKKEFAPYITPEIQDWLDDEKTMLAFEQRIIDYVKFRLPVTEILLTNDRSRAFLSYLCAVHFRFGLQDEKGFIQKAYYSRNWHNYAGTDSDVNTKERWLIDPTLDDIALIKTEKSINQYFYKTPIATHRTYYPLAPAYAVKSSGWLDNGNQVPLFYTYLQKNQMSPKYHIEVHREYLAEKYKGRWEKADENEINTIFGEELKHFNEMMHGVKNTGNNIMTMKLIDKILNKEISGWTITELKGSVFEKGYLELDDRATLHIQRAVGIDPTLQGANKSGMGAGSGSDKREAFNIHMATATRHVSAILSPFYWCFKYNGFTGPQGQKLKLRIITPTLQTQNQVTPSQRETVLPQ